MPQVQVIQPIQQQPKRLRVAAYARVSSDSEDQLNSLAVQVDYYTHLIQENPNWEFAGIYTDEGITGTSTKRREQFNRLMDDCRAGLIDRVLVKSASRFARNTADALSSVRELKSLGVTVAFEKEGFDTETSNGEMLLSIICAVAQEESLSISQNMKWGIHKRMRTGNYITNATPFGYTQINHQLVPEKNNAMIVNDIFKSYLSGMSINEIAEHLNTIYPKENSKWNPRTIHAILRNEKYIGDSLYQKTYTTDSLPLKRYLNTGQRSKYYAMETHEGIISKTDYEKVQNLLAKKSITGEIDRQQNHLTPRYTYRHQTAKRTDIIIRKSTMSNARIIEIPATRQIRSGKNNTMRKMRVAAYCRVSTEEEEQQGSFETQKLYYTEKINSTSEWELAGIYADDGISGIHTKKRDGFNQMIQDCKKKKIDLILTKSISRFARNTLDSIQYVRMLKAIGIAVIFEKENINTSTMNSEMILTVLSAFAQAESESISQNVARGKRMGFRQGKFPFPYGQILGYRKGLDGKPEVIPEEAEVIRMIFNSYLQGASLLTIKKKLEAGGVLTARGNKKWSSESVQRILQNEKYCGDVLLQKTFIEDVLTGVSKKNTGQLPQYYIENNHEGIVTKQMFREVQAEIARRNSKSAANQRKRHQGRYNSKYALSERLVCGDCGSPYKRVTWNIHGRKQIVWRCVNRLEYGTKFCSHSPSIPEEELHQAILKAVQNLAANFTDEVAAQLDGILRQMKAGENLKAQLQKQLEKAQQEFDRLLEMSLELDESTPFLDDKLRKLSGKIKILKANIAESTDGKGEDEEATKQLTAQDLLIKEYDDILTARIIEKVIVHSRQEIEIYFIGGYTQKIDLI